MDWIRDNKTQATILGIFGAIALALGVLLFLANSDYGTSLEELESATSKLVAKEKAPLYPNEANVKALEGKVGEYEKSVGTLSGTLLNLQAERPLKDIADTEFQAKLKQSIAEIREKVGQGSKVLPKDFAFGFETYTISLPRSPEAAKALNDYFDTVHEIVMTAVDAGVESINQIKRTELVVEKGAPPVPPVQPTAPKKAQTKANTKKGKGAIAVVPKPVTKVVERRTLTLGITADQAALQALLNTLASPSKMPYFTVVRLLRVENQKQEGPLKTLSLIQPNQGKGGDVAPTAESVAANAPAAAAKVEVITPPTPANRDAMMVMGGEKLHVYLEIDLVRFVEPAADTADSGVHQ